MGWIINYILYQYQQHCMNSRQFQIIIFLKKLLSTKVLSYTKKSTTMELDDLPEYNCIIEIV
ncbi:hypothetical protein AsAng_0058880 [Aureispira anguillae]|uniref:Uncharacterized protein n=1 Tax=Aureispira anguillae TaxID=2864201 RepID=A0A915YKX0_9BACT|nr:hypothetical protein AsAng_0058880 [Aureispira anguillae]